MEKLRITFFVLLIFSCLSALQSCSSPEQEKTKLYESALEHIKNNSLDAAILQLKSAIKVDPVFGPAYYQLGLIYLDENKPKEAFEALVRAADLEPDNLDATLRLAQLYLLDRKIEESRKRVVNVLARDPNNLKSLVLLANIELVDGKFADALDALDRIGPDVENSDELQNVKGRIYAAQEKWTEAEDAFRKAIILGEDNILNYRTLLLLYQKNSEQDKAKALLDKMTVQFPDNSKVYQLLANYYRSVNNRDALLDVLLKIVDLAPEVPWNRLQLAEFYRQNNKGGDAEKVLLDALTEFPDNPDASASLATLYVDQRKYEEAEAIVSDLEQSHPGHAGIKLIKARFFLNDGKVTDGVTLLQELNKDYPDWGEPFFYLGLAHYSSGEIDLAQNATELAIQKHGVSAKYHTLLAQIFQTQGAFKEAQEQALLALHLNPNDIRPALILSRALIDLKKYTQAIALLSDINSQVEGNVEVLGNLALANLGEKDHATAQKYLFELLDIQPGNTQAVQLLLQDKYKDSLEEGEEFLRQQIQEAPEKNRLYLILAEVLIEQAKYDEAHGVYGEMLERHPDSKKAHMAEAQLFRRLNKNNEAIDKYSKVLEKWPDTLQAHMGSADLLQLNGNNEQAMYHYREVLKLQEDYAPAANNLAWLIASEPNGDLGEALMLAMRAREVSPNSPSIADTLGWVHLKRQSYSLAKTQFEFALERLPNNPTIAYHLALALRGAGQLEKADAILKRLIKENSEFPEREAAQKMLITQ